MKLTLRDLFWLTVVVAMGLGWWIDRTRLADEVERESLQHYLEHATTGGYHGASATESSIGTAPITLD